ncbi:hypothetical protein STVA_49390 [Allostella vacuolata]|nr:hypothetical protein STVA_49390 [Stella vacuolata]
MPPKPAPETASRAVNLRMREEVRAVIDRAARLRGKTRSDFMIEAALSAAEDAILDQTLVMVDPATFRHYLEVLDRPPASAGFARLMSAPRPWTA